MKPIDEYIKKYCIKHEIDEETAKSHAIVQIVSKNYEKLSDGESEAHYDNKESGGKSLGNETVLSNAHG